MGREIRKVIPNWEHPKVKKLDYRTRDGQFMEENKEWKTNINQHAQAKCIKQFRNAPSQMALSSAEHLKRPMKFIRWQRESVSGFGCRLSKNRF